MLHAHTPRQLGGCDVSMVDALTAISEPHRFARALVPTPRPAPVERFVIPLIREH
jgi:hypothetical protein